MLLIFPTLWMMMGFEQQSIKSQGKISWWSNFVLGRWMYKSGKLLCSRIITKKIGSQKTAKRWHNLTQVFYDLFRNLWVFLQQATMGRCMQLLVLWHIWLPRALPLESKYRE